MGSSTSDDVVLAQFLDSMRARRRRGFVACALGTAFILFQVWLISIQFERARALDLILATRAEIDPAALATMNPIQTSAAISMSIALYVMNGLGGLFGILVGILLVGGTQSARVLEVLVRRGISPR